MLDLIGPYIIRIEGRDDSLILKVLTIIDLETGWFLIARYNDKQADTIANLVEQT